MEEHTEQASSAPSILWQRDASFDWTGDLLQSKSGVAELESEPSGFQTITSLVSATQKAVKDSQVQAFPSIWVRKWHNSKEKAAPGTVQRIF